LSVGTSRSGSKTLKNRSQSLSQHERIRSRSPIKPSKSSRRFHSSKRMLGGNKSIQLYAIGSKVCCLGPGSVSEVGAVDRGSLTMLHLVAKSRPSQQQFI
jgi:hypothetical protein